ncbi:MAG: hypothetical protein ACREM2_02980 [Vulcanimicrobiaceae bacterium]
MCSLTAPAPLVQGGAAEVARAIAAVLARFGGGALRFAAERGVKIVPLADGQRYREASPALRRLGVDVDRWPAPPAGLFVVEERSVYLRVPSPMTIAHEFGHALDCALGGGVYRSGYDHRIRAAYAAARDFVTPYAASGLDEYFAESMRAFVEVNDATSPWPRVSRAGLRRFDPRMAAAIEEIFARDFLDEVPSALAYRSPAK